MTISTSSILRGVATAAVSVFLITSANANTSDETSFGVAGPNVTSAQGLTVSFDFTQPASIERCRMTKELAGYLNTLPKDDIETLTHAKQFLVSCHKLMSDAKTQPTPYIADNVKAAGARY